ncbi:MAG: hypothetical protein WAL98_00685 [Desulfatiglandaceae bacterium]
MKKTKILISIIISALFFLSGTQVWASGNYGKRHYNQQKRIHQGIRSGDLTRGEYGRLERDQWRMRHAERRAWSDRQVTRRERKRAGRYIYRARHNRAVRIPRRPVRIVERPRLGTPYVASYDAWSPQVHFGGRIGDPSWSFGWSINVP